MRDYIIHASHPRSARQKGVTDSRHLFSHGRQILITWSSGIYYTGTRHLRGCWPSLVSGRPIESQDNVMYTHYIIYVYVKLGTTESAAWKKGEYSSPKTVHCEHVVSFTRGVCIGFCKILTVLRYIYGPLLA